MVAGYENEKTNVYEEINLVLLGDDRVRAAAQVTRCVLDHIHLLQW